MALSLFNFTKNWTESLDFPTVERNEAKVREDMQFLFDELKNGLNGLITNLFAANIPFQQTTGVPATTVQDAIENVQEQISGVVLSQIPNDSVTTAKLKDGAVTTAKLDDGAVTAEKLSAGAVSGKANLSGAFLSGGENARTVSLITASKTLALGDSGKLLNVNSNGTVVLTVPTDSAVAFPVGTEIEILRAGNGEVAIATTGLTFYAADPETDGANRYVSLQQGHRCLLKKIGENAWFAECIGNSLKDRNGNSKLQYSNVDIGPGAPLPTGTFYFVYA